MTHTQLKLQGPAAGSHLGKYRLVATLGEGGMGTVHLALASGLGTFRKLIVIKELRRDVPWKDTSLAMFMDEAHLASRLDHPNLLQTFEAGEDQGRYFLAMEYLDGQPLSALIERCRSKRRTRALPLKLQLFVLCEVLNGLSYAHQLRDYDGKLLNIVHRDISPQNVFVTYHGQVKIVDFGVARADGPRHQTSPGVFKGKFAYAAPEQLLGRPVDARCDLFSVGVMLWEALAGEYLCNKTPTPEAFQQRTTGGEPSIRQVRPDVDPRLAAICDRALALDPNQRFPSAEAFRRELQDYLQGRRDAAALPERVDGAQLGELMRDVFATERAVMHQVIERAVSVAGATHSTIQALPLRVTEEASRAKHSQAAARHEPESHVRTSAKLRAEIDALRGPRPTWQKAAGLASLGAIVFAGTFELIRALAGPQPQAAERVATQISPATDMPASAPVAPRDVAITREPPARELTAANPSAPTPANLPRTAAAAPLGVPDAARTRAKPARAMPRPAATRPAPERPAANRPALEHLAPTRPALERPAANRPALEHLAPTRPALEHPASTRPALEHLAPTRPALEHPASTRPALEHLAPTRPTLEHPASTRPALERPAATRSVPEGPAPTRSAAERPRAAATPAKTAAAAQRTAAARDASDDIRMGSDLRALHNHAAGWVDVEDPYR